MVPLYREVAQMLFSAEGRGRGKSGQTSEQLSQTVKSREKLHRCLMRRSIWRHQQEQDQAFADTLLRIKTESLAEKNRNWNPTDMAGLQEIIKAKKELEELGRKRRELHISFE